ncbi:hypothetical protein ACQWTT_001202 [Acinetobacter baumannii]
MNAIAEEANEMLKKLFGFIKRKSVEPVLFDPFDTSKVKYVNVHIKSDGSKEILMSGVNEGKGKPITTITYDDENKTITS